MRRLPPIPPWLLAALLGALAAPASAATFTVNASGDPGDGTCDVEQCTLREAIEAANTSPGPDLVLFDLGSATIEPLSQLPALTDPGTTIRGNGDIVLDGGHQPVGPGIEILSDGNKIQGLEIRSFPLHGVLVGSNRADQSASDNVVGVDGDGISDELEGNVIHSNALRGVAISAPDSVGNVVAGNLVGTDGHEALPNGSTGVSVSFRSHGNRIGTNRDGVSDDLERNVISANATHGVSIGTGCEHNSVAGNYIGFEADGIGALGNGADGVSVSIANLNTIGPGNVIGNNVDNGVSLGGSAWNRVIGNFIGVDATGTGPAGNGFNGIRIFGTTSEPGNNNWIGFASGFSRFGTLVQAFPNVIAYSAWHGIYIDSHLEGFVATDNPILFNSIHSNELLGIELVPNTCPATGCTDGVTPNDPGDTDGGGNSALNFPEFRSVTTNGATTYILAEIVAGLPNRTFTIQFFNNSECDGSGHGEGEVYLGQTTAYTDGAGNGLFFASLPVGTAVGDPVTATATERGVLGLFPKNSSEFSACYEVGGATFVLAIDAVRDLLEVISASETVDTLWVGLLEARVERAADLAARGRILAAHAQLRSFRWLVRLLGWFHIAPPEATRSLLASSGAALDLLQDARGRPGRPGPPWRRPHHRGR